MEPEEWNPAYGWEGRYEVSNLGRVRSLDTAFHPGRLKKLKTRGDGRVEVSLYRGDRMYSRSVHRLVLESFIGPRPGPEYEACHGNGDPSDNRLANLRWGTHSDNQFDSVGHGTHNQARKTHCPKGHPYDEDNTYRTAKCRACRICRKERMQANRARYNINRREARAKRRGIG